MRAGLKHAGAFTENGDVGAPTICNRLRGATRATPGPAPTFFEPFSRTSYWDRQEERISLPTEGTYTVAAWHPEGDVWTHTLHCMDAFAAEKVDHPWEDLVVGMAVLCHDLGKPDTTTTDTPNRNVLYIPNSRS